MIKGLIERHNLAVDFQSGSTEAFSIASVAPLFRFKVYQTREAAEAEGHKLAPYTTERPVKSWIDLKPPSADEFGEITYLMLATTRNGCGDTALTGPDQKPYLRNYKMTPEEAAALNIPPKGDFPDKPQPKGEWNIPCRDLQANEVLGWGFGAVPVVQDKTVKVEPSAAAATVDLSPILVQLEEIRATLAVLIGMQKSA